jgi:hypothetical protein
MAGEHLEAATVNSFVILATRPPRLPRFTGRSGPLGSRAVHLTTHACSRSLHLVEGTYLAIDACCMTKKPEPPKPISWSIRKIAAKRTWVGEVEATDEREAIDEKAATEFRHHAALPAEKAAPREQRRYILRCRRRIGVAAHVLPTPRSQRAAEDTLRIVRRHFDDIRETAGVALADLDVQVITALPSASISMPTATAIYQPFSRELPIKVIGMAWTVSIAVAGRVGVTRTVSVAVITVGYYAAIAAIIATVPTSAVLNGLDRPRNGVLEPRRL